MPLTAPERLTQTALHPRILDLWFALQPLRSVVSFMNTGAHPDDETSAMLAAMGFRDGIALSYACANRGEGGQNDIGTEMSEDLGTLRTAEMERAADQLAMRLYWLSEHPKDSIFDFGFSKSGDETLAKWGARRTLNRFVEIVRCERPDILCPTFLNVPGQHGHHRAMTQAAHQVMDLAADPDFVGSTLPVWQVKKLYLPAWSGAGQAYDDDLPPPPATLVVKGTGKDPISSWSYATIGQMSRAFHKTQGMGRWVPPGDAQNWPLHLAASHVAGPDTAITSGLPGSLDTLAQFAQAPELTAPLARASEACARAIAAFPEFDLVTRATCEAVEALREARIRCPAAAMHEVLHRVERKERQLAHVIRLATGATVNLRSDADWLARGAQTRLTVETDAGAADAMEIAWDLPEHWALSEDDTLTIGPDAALSDPYPASHKPDAPRAPAMVVTLTNHGVTTQTRVPFEVPPVVLPSASADLVPMTALINTATPNRSLRVDLRHLRPQGASAQLSVPDGWQAKLIDGTFEITAPRGVAAGLYTLPLTIDGAPALAQHLIRHAHIAPRARVVPASVTVRVLEARLDAAKVGYIGGGHDRVAHWLSAMGADVTPLRDTDLESDAGVAGFDTIVIGIFALRFRAGLTHVMPRLHRWAKAGGTLVTLYHRPWDNWDPDSAPPLHLEIGQPSLRWRVTDENAEVQHLMPDHRALNQPNAIGPEDWANWHKERGLYFASSYAPQYTALLSMADPGETPHKGALLIAPVGKGQHIHCALILHHQMEKLTPGAFRIMANLIARPK